MEPRPISLTQIDEAEYKGAFEPQEYVIVGPIPGGGGGGGGGDVSSVNGKTGSVVLNATDVGAAPTNHTQAISTITGLQSALDTKATAADLDNTFGIATEAHEIADEALGKANTAVQPAALASYVPNTRTVAGKPLSGNITLDKVDVGLSNVDNVAAANMPVSSAQQTALDAKVPTSRTVAGKALTSNITLAKGDVGLGNVDNTADSAKPVSTAQQSALDGKVPTSRTVAGKALSADVTLVKGDVGLSNVDNTSDANKPVSSATQTALNSKVGATGLAGITAIDGPYANKAALPATGTAGVLYIYRAG